MTELIITSIVICLLITSLYMFQWANPKKETETKYRIVSAGCADGDVRLCAKATNISNMNFVSNGQRVNSAEYIPYVVEGESMSANDIHTGDIVLTKDLTGEERLSLEKDNIVVFSYTKECDNTETVYYKLRQFIAYIQISENLNIDDWCTQNGIAERAQFKIKYDKAITREHHDSEVYLCSKTWHDNKLDYSFHSIISLKGKVCFSIPAERLR